MIVRLSSMDLTFFINLLKVIGISTPLDNGFHIVRGCFQYGFS
jgi:hypothetical protein